jgi:2-oxoglutarate ferredoxin oxidoreductase subunit alpha
MTTARPTGADLPLQQQEDVVIRFAGDSGDGMQITGNQFTNTSAVVGNDLATLPDFPAEIRAPAGSRPGVSGFQLHFSSSDIHTPGDAPDVLVAMNPAALVINIKDLKQNGIVVVNTSSFNEKEFGKAKLDSNPLEDGMLEGYRVVEVDITKQVRAALAESGLTAKEVDRCKNFFTLGLMYWLFSRPLEPTMKWLDEKFAKRPELAEANKTAMKAGYNAGDIHELFQGRYEVPPCDDMPPGTYRNILGNQALGLGLVAGGELAGLKVCLGAYPITPASDILHQLSGYKHYGVVTLQVEDEIAAICAAIGGSYAGMLGVTASSGPGIALKTEALGLAVSTELPLVVVNVQRAGPSTGMPTKVEQTDLLQSVLGRNGEAPIPVIACASPADAFECAVEACRIAVEYMTPVFVLSDNYIANGSEPWRLPAIEDLEPFEVKFHTEAEGFQPYSRNEKGARPWVKPGTPGLEHRIGGLEKADGTGHISYDPENHERMTMLRDQKIMGIAKEIPLPDVIGPQTGELLVVGWGSSQGPIRSAVESAQREGKSAAALHLRHVWPLPHGLGDVFGRYEKILIPEMNLGQLKRLLMSELPGHDYISYPKVQGKPFFTHEVLAKINEVLEAK